MTTSAEFRRIKENPDKYQKEKGRINEYIKNRYNTDPEYKAMILERNRKAYEKRKELKNNLKE